MERLTELEMNSIGFAILCNFPRFCGEERAKEASDMFRAMKAEIVTYRALGTVEELAEMVKARGENKAYKIESFYCAICKENHGRVVETNGIYFTRAEAEAALSGGGGDG